MKRADEMNTVEYLKRHLRDRVMKGKYEYDFNIVKDFVLEMQKFSTFKEFIETVRMKENIKMKETVIADLIRIYQKRMDLRQSIGVVLLMVLWGRLIRLAPGEWFDDAYYWLFVEAETFNPDEPDVIEHLMETIRGRIRVEKCSDTTIDETNDYDDEPEDESEEEIKKDSESFLSFCSDWWSEYMRSGDEATDNTEYTD
jgi:hypothetical protein